MKRISAPKSTPEDRLCFTGNMLDLPQNSLGLPQDSLDLPEGLCGAPEDMLTVRLSVAAAELQALCERLGRAGYEIAGQTGSEEDESTPNSKEQDREPCLSGAEFMSRFVCMTTGGAVAAAGLTSSLSFGVLGSPLLTAGSVGAALAGAALCAGGLLLGQTPKAAPGACMSIIAPGRS